MIIAEICSVGDYKKKYFMRKDLYDSLCVKFDKFYFINCHELINKKKIKIDKKIFKDKKIIFFHPKNYEDLNNFLKKNKIFLINNLSPKLYHLKIHLTINKANIYQVAIDNLGELSNYKMDNWISVNAKKKIYFLYIKKFAYLVYRILQLCNLIKQIEILYIARKDIKEVYNKMSFSKLIFKRRYKKLKPVLPKIGSLNIKSEEKYIVHIDLNVNHKDNYIRGYTLKKKEQIRYLLLIKKYLSQLKKAFRKQIVICLHPSSDISFYKKHIKNIKLIKYKTEFFLKKAFLISFHESSSITAAILLKKKIIQLDYKPLGKYIERRGQIYQNKFNLMNINLESFLNTSLDRNKMLYQLKKNANNYFKNDKAIYFIGNNYNDISSELSLQIKKLKNDKNFN